MGQQSKLKHVRRMRKELDKILNLGLQTGNIIKDEEGDFVFKNEMLAKQVFLRLMSAPEILHEVIEKNPKFLQKLFPLLANQDKILKIIEASNKE